MYILTLNFLCIVLFGFYGCHIAEKNLLGSLLKVYRNRSPCQLLLKSKEGLAKVIWVILRNQNFVYLY